MDRPLTSPSVMTIREFKKSRPVGASLADCVLRKQFVADVEKARNGQATERTLTFVISTERKDRDGDVILVDGWDLKAYKKNPVVLWAHDYWSPPIAQTIAVVVENGKLRATAQFTPADLSPFGFMIYRLYDERYLRATSVGFIPIDYKEAEGQEGNWFADLIFEKQELLEYSAVPVPSNPEALIDAKTKGIDLAPYVDWAERILDDPRALSDVYVPRKALERLWMTLAPTLSVSLPGPGLGRRGLPQAGITKRVISYAQAHPDGTALADRDAEWDAGAEVAAAEVDDLKIMCTWVNEANEDAKGSYTLPHHRQSDKAVVFRALAAAAGRLDQTDIPEADKDGVRTHLGRHYREFDETPPWERSAEGVSTTVADEAMAALEMARTQAASCLGMIDEALALLMAEEASEEESVGSGRRMKMGRVLSAVNEGRIREARDRLDLVLEQLETENPEQEAVVGESGRPATVADPAGAGVGSPAEVYRIAETETDGVAIEEDVRTVIRETVQAELRTVVTQLTGKVY